MKNKSIIDQMKREILQDISDGIVPETVSSFSELHDYVDANEYGGFCVVGGPNELHKRVTHEEIDELQTIIDSWMKLQ